MNDATPTTPRAALRRPLRPPPGRRCCALSLGPATRRRPTPSAAQPRVAAQPVTLNFVNADIEAVTRAMAAMLNQQFVVDPRVKGTITLYSEQPLSPREAYLNYLAALRGLGFTVVESRRPAEGRARGRRQAAGRHRVGRRRSAARGDQVMTQIFRLNHENPNNLVPVLRPLISPNNTINANPGNNTLVITDYADNLQRIGKIIAALDQPAAGDVEVIPLQHAVAADIAPLVQRLTDSGGGAAGVPGVPAAAPARRRRRCWPTRAATRCIVRAANPARMASIRALVDKLDRPVAGRRRRPATSGSCT